MPSNENMPTAKQNRKKTNAHDGSNLDDFLREEGILEDVETTAERLRKSSVAGRMRTSRAALDRLLDPDNTSLTLATLNRAAHAVGRKLTIKLQPA